MYDKRLLRLIRKYLQAGMMENGVCSDRTEGTPQGGPLSPFLANFLLDELDQELMKRGHSFCRYADDCNIYVSTQKAGERVMESVTAFIEKRLKLRVNREKSAVGFVGDRKFLGHRLLPGGKLGIAPKSLKAAKDKIRKITKRNRGKKLSDIITELNRFLSGWIVYYRHARMTSHLRDLESWIERKLRCYRLKQRKKGRSIREFLVSLGVPKERARLISSSRKSWWSLSRTPPVHEALSRQWIRSLGLISVQARFAELNL